MRKPESNKVKSNKIIPYEFNKFNNEIDYNIFLKFNYNNLLYYTNDEILSYKQITNLSYKNLYFTVFKGIKQVSNHFPEYKSFPLLISSTKILVPKVIKVLERKSNSRILKEIDEDIESAKELCLLFLSQLVNYYYTQEEEERFNFKNLKVDYLRNLFSQKNNLYKIIIDQLILLDLIETDSVYKVSLKSYGYRINPQILKKGLNVYELKTKKAVKYFKKKQGNIIDNNLIINNLLNFYKDLTFPSREEVLAKGIEMAKNKVIIKNKLVTYLNHHKKSYYSKPKNRIFIEDSIFKYECLILKLEGLKLPTIGPENAGNRVYDTLNLLPTWIRRMVKYKGEFLKELDYKCLHPNIVVSIYGGKEQFITHDSVARKSGIPKNEVKKEHLSLFNMSTDKIKYNKLYNYYMSNASEMMFNLISDKINNTEFQAKDRHKITSKIMFRKEVEIIKDVISQLNTQNIYVMYVFDALWVHPNHEEKVKEIMNSVVLKHGVMTSVN
jgi:hypothetical protein